MPPHQPRRPHTQRVCNQLQEGQQPERNLVVNKGTFGATSEVIHQRGPWGSFEAIEFTTPEWVDWFNHRRQIEPIGNIPPAEAEDRYYAMIAWPALNEVWLFSRLAADWPDVVPSRMIPCVGSALE